MAAPYLRPVVLVTTAYIFIGIIHELAHALSAHALDVPFTFQFGVDVARVSLRAPR
jgi:hypothetical protein